MATTSVAPTRPGDVGLKREMGLIGAMWSSETSIIGSGWLFGSYVAAMKVGSAAIICWGIGAVAVIILALVHAELGGLFPVAGGTARFPHLAFGSVAGISFGFFSWLQAVTVAPVECFAVMTYGSYFQKAPWMPIIFNPATGDVTHWGFALTLILMAIFTAVNFLAMRWFNKVNATLTWWKVAIPVATIIVLLFKFHGSNFSAGGGFIPKGVGWKAIFGAIPGASIVFAYLGFEQADQLAGEIKNPQKNLPRAIIGSILIGAVVYILLQVAFIGATPASLLHHGFAGIVCPAHGHCSSIVTNIVSGPFAGLSGALKATTGVAFFGVWAIILRLDAFISPAGTGLVYVTSTSRVGYGLARNRYYPSIFTKVDKNGIPWFSLIIAFVFGLVFLFPFPSWIALVNLVTLASVLMYAGAPLALGALRNQLPDAERPYRLPGAVWLSPLAFMIASEIIYLTGFGTVWRFGIALALGYIMILMAMADNPKAPKLDWARSAWIGAYLLGMGIISWQGQYGPDNTFRIHFWWDLGIVAAFSLAIYMWAMMTALPRAEVEALMAQQAGSPDEAPPAPEAAAA